MKKHGYTAEERRQFERGRPDYHDPTAGIGGAAPAYSALSVRLVFAVMTLILAIGAGVLGLIMDAAWLSWLMLVLGMLMVIDIVVIVRRKRRGEPG